MRSIPLLSAALIFAAAASARVGATELVYVNRCTGSCMVTGGADDAVNEISSIISGTHTIVEFSFAAPVFDDTVACLQSKLAPFDFRVVTTKPTIAHHQIVLAGAATQAGLPGGVFAAAPYSPGVVRPNAIGFVFANDVGGDAAVLCWYAAQQLGTMYGLDIEYYCPDLMSYLSTCDVATKSFTNVDAPCGEFGPRTCNDPAASQNSYLLLGARARLNAVFADGYE